jgi:ribonuclease VapC
MIVDASALLAILLREADGQRFYTSLGRAGTSAVSAVNYVEAGIRADQDKTGSRGKLLDELMQHFNVQIASITPEQATLAREAYRRYGKGRHPAHLNLGDCFAYALAKLRREPLLFKGEDFRKTDVESAL